MKKRALLLMLTLVLLITCAVFTVSASGVTTSVKDTFVCPCSSCVEALKSDGNYKPTWTELTVDNYSTLFTGTTSGGYTTYTVKQNHYYVKTDFSIPEALSVGKGSEPVILLDNCSLTIGSGVKPGSRPLSVTATDAVLHLVGNNDAKLNVFLSTAAGGMSQIGGTTADKKYELHLYGDLTIDKAENQANTPQEGGLFKIYQGILRIHDNVGMGLLNSDDPVLFGQSLISGKLGGVVWLQGSKASFVMDAGTLNGSAVDGGAVYQAAGTVNINGGTVYGGNAVNGGAIYVVSGTTNINGGEVRAVTDTEKCGNITKGGAIYIGRTTNTDGTTKSTGTVNVGNASLSTSPAIYGGAMKTTTSGETTTHSGLGGAIYVEYGTLNVNKGNIYANVVIGFEPKRGGAIYSAVDGSIVLNNGTITGSAKSIDRGGAIYTGGNLTVNGGSVTGGHAARGGNIFIAKTMTMAGGEITLGNASASGGNLFVSSGDVDITGGTVSGGSGASYGGNIYLYHGTLDISDTANKETVIQNGTATVSGGDIYVNNTKDETELKQGTCTINLANHADSKISGGTAPTGGSIYTAYKTTIQAGNISGKTVAANEVCTVTNGGTIYVAKGELYLGTETGGPTITGTKLADAGFGATIYVANGTVDVKNTTINGGTVKNSTTKDGFGGAIYQKDGSFTMENTSIVRGNAYRGGCVYVNTDAEFTMKSGSISGGDSSNKGGQVYVAGTFNMQGGTVTANPADTHGAPGFRVQGGTLNLSGDAVVISAGSDADDAIDVVTASPTSTTSQLTLADTATVKNKDGGTDGDNIINMANYAGSRTKLTVKAGWSGKARTTMDYLIGSDKIDGVQYAVGMVLDKEYAAAEGTFTGELILETAPNQPPLIYNESGALQVCPIRLCTYNLPKLDAQWFTSATAAAAAAQPGDYIDIHAPVTMDIGAKDVLVDFNGNDCVVTGTGTLSILDAAGDNYDGTLAKITYNNVGTNALNPYNDRQYIALPNGDGTYSAHRIDLRISAVSVRPTSAGVYYTASLECDDILREKFSAAGVAVSLESVPGENFVEQSLYTEIKELKAEEFTGVLINEILKTGENNDSRGKMPIYANAYATFTVEGQPITILADAYNAGKTKGNFLPGHTYTAYSLSDVMNAIDLRWRTLDEAAKTSVMENLYKNYDNVMRGWDLQYMIGQVKNLKVLTIGNSLSVDAGHMLGYIAKIEGMEKVRFSTLYYGGCTLRQHANFLTDNTPEYRWYDTDAASPDKKNLTEMTPGETVPYVISRLPKDQITMYEGIVKDKWDIIVLQQGVFEAAKSETYGEDLQTLIDYVRKHATNPNMVLMWNMIWAGPVEAEMVERSRNDKDPNSPDYEKNYEETTGEPEMLDQKPVQNKMFELIRNAVQEKIVPNDIFIDIMPSGTAQQNALWSGLYDHDMYRDYIHASDLARYIYSYVWYCTLTDADFNNVAEEKVPLAVRIITNDISEIPKATEDLDLTETVEGYDYSLLDVVNHSIASALENPFTPKGIND